MNGGKIRGREDKDGECGQNESASVLLLPVKASTSKRLKGNREKRRVELNEGWEREKKPVFVREGLDDIKQRRLRVMGPL